MNDDAVLALFALFLQFSDRVLQRKFAIVLSVFIRLIWRRPVCFLGEERTWGNFFLRNFLRMYCLGKDRGNQYITLARDFLP